jgi:hypothetical protein
MIFLLIGIKIAFIYGVNHDDFFLPIERKTYEQFIANSKCRSK